MKKLMVMVILFIGLQQAQAQSDKASIRETLLNYIEGTANGEPDRVKDAFHEDLNLYHIKKGELVVWSGKGYTNNIKPGKKSNRIGKILSIDMENDAAMAKIEIKMPGIKRIYTDYLMLLKVKGKWKIIHKSFTYRTMK
ncbi:nuclear transport factor 2 family protein [Flavobacteriaceae bacterium S356]|uniref:Nuclear transport factor 2 family protein n=1 Tax=Asprobacillus argus TaxID=3076534 RepID=A0ABU3LDH3_9FLAO|nr:nuclear transport factor 2 family protein [Flavobacteriaceae bacterium S356]